MEADVCGEGVELSPILQPLAPFQDQLTVVSGCSHLQALSLGDGQGEHSRSSATWLNGVHPKHTQGADVRAGVTADQVAAAELGNETQLASLELSMDQGFLVGNCENGYQLHVYEHGVVADCHYPASDGIQSAGRLRAAVRRGSNAAERLESSANKSQHARSGSEGHGPLAEEVGPCRSRSSHGILRCCPRRRASASEGRTECGGRLPEHRS